MCLLDARGFGDDCAMQRPCSLPAAQLMRSVGRLRTQVTRKRIVAALVSGTFFAGTSFIWLAQRVVEASSGGRIYESAATCPHMPVALVLGVAKNKNYWPRLRAASELFRAGKVDAIIVSGDNPSRDYDEPTQMKSDLAHLGIPESFVTCDFAGRRTLDSVVRAKEVFGQPKFVIVSQRYHCKRALFLAKQYGCDAVALSASQGEGYGGRGDRAREVFARAKALFDSVFGVQPRFLGKHESVTLRGAT